MLFPLGIPTLANAQSNGIAETAPTRQVELSGVVRNAAGAPLAAARVTATSGTATQSTQTSADGRFSFRSLPADTYTIVVDLPGYERVETAGVTIMPGKAAVLPVTLTAGLETIGRVSTTIPATAINISSASIASVQGGTFTDQGQTSVLNVLDQLPGVDVMHYQGGAPAANSNITIRGAQPYEIQVMIDGHPVNSSAAGAYGFNSTFLNSLLIGGVDAEKGPGSMPDVVANAVGGTLNFRTPAITSTPHADALVGYDSWGGAYYAIKASDTIGKLGFLFGVANDNTPGYMSPTQVLLGYHTGTPTPASVPPSTISGAATMTQNFSTKSQLAKVSYAFSPVTALTLTDYSTQTYADESSLGSYSPFKVASQVCTTPAKTTCYYTAPQYQGLIGQTVNIFSDSDHEDEYDIEPFLTAELRTSIGPGTLRASAYAGSIVRTINGDADSNAVSACITPSCSQNYYQAPFGEIQRDVQRGADAQYTMPFGNEDQATFGYEHNLDIADMCEGATTPYHGISGSAYNCTPGAGFFSNVPVSTDTFSLRFDVALAAKLRLQMGNYFSSATGVTERYDPHIGLVFRPNASTAIRASYGTSFVTPFAGYALPSTNVTGSGAGATLVSQATNDKPETSSGFDVGTDIATQADARLSLDVYSTTIFNRFATVTTAATGTYNGTPYFNVQANFNQANSREEGIELSYVKAPRYGFGYNVDAQLNRDYAYAQAPVTGTSFGSTTVFATANGVQIPESPFSRETYAVTYAFREGAVLRVGATSYGQWNAFGQPGFTVIDSNVKFPLAKSVDLNLGVTNMSNQGDASNVFTINNYGYSYPSVSGAPVYRQNYPYQPRTFFIQLHYNFGK
jgi:hypothetical protein